MGVPPGAEILQRNPNHGPPPVPSSEAVRRQRAIVHHAVRRRAANAELALHFDRFQEAIVGYCDI
jgi:hypothetical protein